MAVTKTVLKASEAEAVVKITGVSGDTTTINLATDILASSQEAGNSTQTVFITGMQWTGVVAGVATITRNNVIIATLNAGASGALDMSGQMMVPDSTQATQNIVVTITGGQTEVWLRLKKVTGYKTKIEYGVYGSYDDETIVGARDVSGSPDYTG